LEWKVTKAGENRPIEQFGFEPLGGDAQNRVYSLRLATEGSYTFDVAAVVDSTRVSAQPLTIVVRSPQVAGPAGTPPQAPSEELSALPPSATPAAAESRNVAEFKAQLRQRIVDIGLPLRDVNFDTRRLDVARALRGLADDSSLDTPDKFNAEFKTRVGEIAGSKVLPENVYLLWRRIFNNDAFDLAKSNQVPYESMAELTDYYRNIASVLESAELKDEVFTAKVAQFLAERGFSVAPSRSAAGSAPRRTRLFRHHR
jgi:hypothetical protein